MIDIRLLKNSKFEFAYITIDIDGKKSTIYCRVNRDKINFKLIETLSELEQKNQMLIFEVITGESTIEIEFRLGDIVAINEYHPL